MFTWMDTTLWSFACICFSMIQFMRTTVICMNFHGGNDCCVVLKSGTKFYAFAVLRNTFHYPLWLYFCNVIKQQVNFLIHYESDCGYKGHNIAYAIRRFHKGLT